MNRHETGVYNMEIALLFIAKVSLSAVALFSATVSGILFDKHEAACRFFLIASVIICLISVFL